MSAFTCPCITRFHAPYDDVLTLRSPVLMSAPIKTAAAMNSAQKNARRNTESRGLTAEAVSPCVRSRSTSAATEYSTSPGTVVPYANSFMASSELEVNELHLPVDAEHHHCHHHSDVHSPPSRHRRAADKLRNRDAPPLQQLTRLEHDQRSHCDRELPEQEMIGGELMKIPPASEMPCDVGHVCHVARAKHNPRGAGQNESAQQHDGSAADRVRIQVEKRKESVAPAFGQRTKNQVYAIQSAPDHIGPVGAVPQAAHGESDEQVQNVPCLADPLSAKRNIDVVLEPG